VLHHHQHTGGAACELGCLLIVWNVELHCCSANYQIILPNGSAIQIALLIRYPLTALES